MKVVMKKDLTTVQLVIVHLMAIVKVAIVHHMVIVKVAIVRLMAIVHLMAIAHRITTMAIIRIVLTEIKMIVQHVCIAQLRMEETIV